MDFVWKDYLPPIREYFLTFPELTPLHLTPDLLQIDYMDIDMESPMTPQGYTVTSVGTNIVDIKEDVLERVILRQQFNTQLRLRRLNSGNEERLETGDFMPNFIVWNNSNNILWKKGFKIPKFPVFTETEFQDFVCKGGVEIGRGTINGVSISEYVLDLFLTYDLVFEESAL